MVSRIDTPWGMSQTVENLTDGAIWVSTASHGGLMLNEAEMVTLPEPIRTSGGQKCGEWTCFEEDCSYALVFEFRPDLSRTMVQRQIDEIEKMQRNPYPERWLAEAEQSLPKLRAKLALPDAEYIKEYQAINREWNPQLFGLGQRCWTCWQLNCKGHADEMIVVSATSGVSWEPPVPPGMVGVHACLGGRNNHGQYASELQMFLVPAAEYDNRARYFVVDPSRHPVWAKPEAKAEPEERRNPVLVPQRLTGYEPAAAEQ